MKILNINLTKTLLLIIISAIAISSTLRAQSDTTMTSKTHSLEEVVVSATRTEQSLKDIPRKVEIITSTDIVNTQANDLSDILKKHAGVDVIQYPGLLSGIGIRGFRPQYSGINQRTLLLIDGRPAGATNLSLIDLNSIERIEVLKGPASALYGSQAMGGVINIVTKKSTGQTSGRVYGGYGSYATIEGGLSIGGNIIKKLDFDLSFNSFNQGKNYKLGNGNLFREGFNFDEATRVVKLNEQPDSVVTINDSRGDGARRRFSTYGKYSGSLRLGYQVSEKWRIDIKGDKFQANDVNVPSDVEFIMGSPGRKDLNRYSTDLIISGKIIPSNTLTVKGFLADEDNNNYSVSTSDSTIVYTYHRSNRGHNTWKGLQVQDYQKVGNHGLTMGVDYNYVTQENISYSKSGDKNPVYALYPNSDLRTIGIYVQGIFNFLNNRLNITAGGRYEHIKNIILKENDFDERSARNNIFNPSIGISFKATDNVRIKSNIGTAFTTVSAFSIAGYYETAVLEDSTKINVYKGNPELKNQNSITYDLGAEYSDNTLGIQAEATWFITKLNDNAVTTITSAEPGQKGNSGKEIKNVHSYTNSETTDLQGIEASLSYDFGARINYRYSLKAFANAVWILKAHEQLDVYLLGRRTVPMQNVADFTLNYGLEYNNFQKVYLKLSGRYVGYRHDTDWSYIGSAPYGSYADIKYPGFMVMDFTGTVKITPQHHLSLLINNLTDENYYEKRGYNLPGRNALVRYSFNF